jgi:hypothetical protein
VFLLAALPLSAAAQDCDVRREVEKQLDATDLEGVLIEAESGSLEVVGADVDRIRVRGVLCASDGETAADALLIVERRQGAAWIEADLPDGGWRDYARMDLMVEMPRSLAADIEDSSGAIYVEGIAAARINDSSGGIEVRDVPGSLIIDDSSGEIVLEDVGDVEIEDSSGEIEIYGVNGSVLITEDGSGEIDIRDVTGDVRIEEDGSGSIEVVGVGGDFILEDDGSGSVRYRDVQGRVEVPEG